MKSPFAITGDQQCQKIIAMIPSHKIYCEPYFIQDTLFFTKGRSQVEILNDSNSNLLSFYKVCQDKEQFLLLHDKIKNTLNFESEYRRALRILKSSPSQSDSAVDTAWAVWAYFNLCSSKPTGQWQLDCSLRSCGKDDVNARRNCFSKEIFGRFNAVQISNRDPLAVLRQADGTETFFYIHTPILSMKNKNEKEAVHTLFESLSDIKGKFILKSRKSRLLTSYIRKNNWYFQETDVGGDILVHNYLIEPLLFYI